MLKGSIDAVHNGQCYGWAMDEALADLEQAGLRGRSLGIRH